MVQKPFDFGIALRLLKTGERVARSGWNGKGMHLEYVAATEWATSSTEQPGSTDLKPLPWIGMKTADGCFVPWLASQTDLLAEDWVGVVL